MNKFRPFLALTKASLKMYYRNKGAIIFTLLIPVALLSIFGFLSRGGDHTLKIRLTNHSRTELSRQLITSLREVSAFRIDEVSEEEGRMQIENASIDLHVVIPENFGTLQDGKLMTSLVQTKFNTAKSQTGQVANLIVVQIVSKFDRGIANVPVIYDVNSEGITTSTLGYFDFILPGILSMSIMQLGIFGVAFSFVALKASGALRRIQATPTHPVYYVFANTVVRLLVTLATAAVLIGFGTYFFDFHMMGNYFEFGIVCVLGILIFLGVGFAIAGWAKDETQAAPIANLIQLPLLLLSGIFFPRDNFPGWLERITDFFPLTYMSHALREVANNGASLIDIPVDIIGMLVWLVIVYVIAVKVFRWE
jgi:ABC-2 type transport system permease protein